MSLAPAEARGHAAMLLFSGLVAGSFSLGTEIANEIDPMALTAARFLLASALIGAIALAFGQMRRSQFRAPWRYLILGALFATYFVLMFEGLKTAPAVSAAAVFTLIPIMAGVFGWLLLRQVTNRSMALALAIGASGALWVIFRGDPGALFAFDIGRGEAIYFVGCIAHALYAPMVPRLNRGEPAVVSTFGMTVAGFLCLLVLGWDEIRATDWAGLRPMVWITLFYLAAFASAATFLLLQYASLRLPASKVMAYTYLTPSWVILWEVLRGKGAPPGVVFWGVALTVVALLMLLRAGAGQGARRQAPQPGPGSATPLDSSASRKRSKAS